MTLRLTRRRLLLGTAAATIVSGCAPQAVVPRGPRRIGYLSSGPAPTDAQRTALREGMKEEGFIEDVDYVIHVRAADGKTEGLVALAKELVSLDSDLIIATTTGSTQAARAVTSTVPIVMVSAHDPVEAGVVADLARPGGNVTGQSLMGGDLMPKQLELLREVTGVRRLAYLTPHVPSPAPGFASVTDVFERSMREKAGAVGIDVSTFTMREPSGLDTVLAALNAQEADALYLIESAAWAAPPAPRPIDRIVQVSLRRRLPSIVGARFFAQAGLLMSYGDANPIEERLRSVSRFVARIFRGAKPGDIPVERPTRFELVLNVKTATALGLTFPRTLLDRADTILQ